MAGGTDIFIISGARAPQLPVAQKSLGITEISLIEMADGTRLYIPKYVIQQLRALYGRNRAAIGAYTITADSHPDFDEWFVDDYWWCSDWMAWHSAMKQKYGLQLANARFASAWDEQDVAMKPYQWCPFNNDFANYFKSQGIDTGWLLSHVFNVVENTVDSGIEVVENVGDGVVNVSEGAKSITTVIKWVAPFAAIGVGIWAVDKWMYPIFGKDK